MEDTSEKIIQLVSYSIDLIVQSKFSQYIASLFCSPWFHTNLTSRLICGAVTSAIIQNFILYEKMSPKDRPIPQSIQSHNTLPQPELKVIRGLIITQLDKLLHIRLFLRKLFNLIERVEIQIKRIRRWI
jgi:hypothetical protein